MTKADILFGQPDVRNDPFLTTLEDQCFEPKESSDSDKHSLVAPPNNACIICARGATFMQELFSVQALTLLAGLFLILVGSFGGGIEVKEIKIPTLPTFSRALSLAFGIALLALGIAFPQLFPKSTPPPSPPEVRVDGKPKSAPDEKPNWRGAAIENGLITVSDVKRVLRHLKLYSGPINDTVDDAYKQAVGEFQISQNIGIDSYVGPVTYGKQREAWPEYFGARNPAK